MKVVFSAKHARHNPPFELELGRFVPFKETPARADNIAATLAAFADGAAFPLVAPADHGLAALLRIHSDAYVAYFRTAYERWTARGGNAAGVFPDAFAVRGFANNADADGGAGGAMGQPGFFCFDMTGVIAEGTFGAAVEAVQVALTAADLLVDENASAAFALTRPPGHHAHEDLCGGYCFFNNAAICVRYLIEEKKVGKVCVLDIDYHHGNGTQAIFYKDSNPLYVSIHGFPDYPMYWGRESEVGEDAGKGFNVNIPLPIGTRDAEYLEALKRVVQNQIKDYKPDVVVVSLGVDTFVEDVVGNFLLTSDCYLEIGKVIASIGKQTLFVMEGGYDLPAIGLNVLNVLRGFEGI